MQILKHLTLISRLVKSSPEKSKYISIAEKALNVSLSEEDVPGLNEIEAEFKKSENILQFDNLDEIIILKEKSHPIISQYNEEIRKELRFIIKDSVINLIEDCVFNIVEYLYSKKSNPNKNVAISKKEIVDPLAFYCIISKMFEDVEIVLKREGSSQEVFDFYESLLKESIENVKKYVFNNILQ